MESREFKPENFARFHPGGQLGRKLLTRAHHVMSRDNIPFVGSISKFQQIVSAMSQSKFGTALVQDENSKLIGVITDGDLRRSFDKFKDAITSVTARDIMSSSPITIHKEATYLEMEQLFSQFKISLLIVTEVDNKVIGVVNIHDLQQ